MIAVFLLQVCFKSKLSIAIENKVIEDYILNSRLVI